ncbi:hypothetical protein LTR99_006932 [Exophiala xenobiotica]|uniref:Actin-like ATPase domain-containing protein n=1 Tax=Vermiconidia calcicola TaxID=1690605 RepID=A0AAV9Q2P5_9PEZI|nr:hypothetical protein LTR92_006749 [Exophiala xenobiotica]KAK5531928.1 hypothetical protein LTR25_008258 [Vermiconidia calcicola]KAK5537244.1 hypothetical protein LTR23_007455 [Chaetothyriales sp. CCFEE 6169]KAK5221245.1 hypothetical protein LTR72_006805 [Exophiala xenobiotica]KAK5229304.1 hypothetical protein LTR47_007906 [Exophiala xenobiotica]
MASAVASAIRPGLRDRQQSGSPHTPSRYISSVQSSPGSSFFRAEEDPIIIELNPRELIAGFQGESGPQCTIQFTPQHSRRVGDYRTYLPDYRRKEEDIQTRSKEYELWRSDLQDVDLGLLEDKLERAVREAYNKHLLVDAGNARLVLVLPSLVPHPVLSTVLTLLFERWKYSSITLLPEPTMTIAAAGLRSGLIVDIGWEETVITAIYEYREVRVRRTVRAIKALTLKIGALLDTVRKEQNDPIRGTLLLDFDFVEEFVDRAGACHALMRDTDSDLTARMDELGLDEKSTTNAGRDSDSDFVIDWPTDTSSSPVSISRAALHQACLECLVGLQNEDHPDDHEQSISQLLYRTLLSLSADVRSICMPRVVVTGHGSRVAGLPKTILEATKSIIKQYGWTAVRGTHFNAKRSGLTELAQGRAVSVDSRHDTTTPVVGDFVEERLYKQKSKDASPSVPVTLRQVESLGPWAGASLVASLKAKSFVEIDREKFLSHGLAGAHRDIDTNITAHRLTTAKSNERTSWTLAGWA